MVPLGQHLVKMEREVKKLQASLRDVEVSQQGLLPHAHFLPFAGAQLVGSSACCLL